MAMADEVRAQISDQELRDLEAELEQARQRIAELESLDYERIIQQPLRARIAELEAALAGDAGNVIYFAEQQALDRAAEEAQEHDCGFRGHELCDCRSKIAAAIRELKEPADGNHRNG
jgi:hypothetical protein